MPRRAIQAALLVLIVVAAASAAGHHHFKQDFYVYDMVTTDFVIGASVTVSWVGGSAQGETRRPHGNVWFIVPGECDWLDVTVIANGYITDTRRVYTNGRPNVGGKGFWIGLMPE
jgi:hypothetical protein